MKKRSFYLLMSLLTLFFLAGCTGNGGAETTDAPVTEKSTVSEEPSASEEPTAPEATEEPSASEEPTAPEATEEPSATEATAPEATEPVTLPTQSSFEEGESTEPTEREEAIRFLHYDWGGWGFSKKSIPCGAEADRLLSALAELTPTGELAEPISDAPFDEGNADPALVPGTMWLEIGETVWRLDPDWTQLSLVERHLGEGRVYRMSEAFRKELSNLYQYYPYDCYNGTYRASTKELTLVHVYEAESDVSVQIKALEIQNEHHPSNTVTLELLSRRDLHVLASVQCERGSDDLAGGETQELSLTKDVPQTVTLNFGGWKDSRFWVFLFVENTRIQLTIEP